MVRLRPRDALHGGQVGARERVRDVEDEACRELAGCGDGEADVEVGDEGEEGAVFSYAAEFVECCGELVG